MRKFCFFSLFLGSLIIASAAASAAFDRQSNADYHARREALARKVGGLVVLFAATENDGPNDLYGFRQDDNFFYLSGLSEPGSALLIVSAAEVKGDAAARAYTEILFLPPRNATQEKWTGPKLGPENPEAPKITGFDRVADMTKLPENVMQAISGVHPVVYTDVAVGGQTSASAGPLEFLKNVNSFLGFQDVKPMIY